MTMATKNEVFQEHLVRYLKASKHDRGKILDHVCFITRLHRKAAVRKFRQLQMHPFSGGETRGRPLYYTPDVTAALKDVWTASSELCGELVHPIIVEYVTALQRDTLWEHTNEATSKLLRMSAGTVKDRVDLFMKVRRRRSGLSATKPSKLKEIIPIFTGPWEDLPPGFGQLDTVVHCGSSLEGNMAFTVNWTDVATLWGKRRAQWNKGQRETRTSLSVIKDKLPFPMQGAHPDTGSEFINWHIKAWCDEQNVQLTRSRPYHKDDNAYVEQKNGHIVRRFLGYTRIDCREAVPAMNALYEILDRYLNHFVPSRKCLEKVRIGSKYRKKYDQAQTPYQRVLAHAGIADEVKERLRTEHSHLNPLLLKQQVDKLIARLFKIQRDSGNPKAFPELGNS